MAHIAHRLGEFTGHIGPVAFVKGHAETDDPDVIAYCADRPDEYDVTEDGAPFIEPDESTEDNPDQE
jgi:hypothetical protein